MLSFTLRRFGLLLVTVLVTIVACGGVPIDDSRNDNRLFPARGVIRGTVTYLGPHPCSQAGHIVGNAVVLLFDRRNPPPPNGLATSAVNFVAVPGDVLFANEPRSVSNELFCPPDSGVIEAAAPFTIAPLEGGSYVISAFYDRRGRFWPTFKFRNLPEAGDLGGGFIDVDDARKNANNLAYEPIYLPIDVGTPQPTTDNEIPFFTIGPDGYVADNIPVTIGSVVPFTRPYFYPQHVNPQTGVQDDSSEVIGQGLKSPGNQKADPFDVPILAISQDVHILAPPTKPTPETLTAYQRGFPSLKMMWGVAASEFDDATDPQQPFGFQLPPLPPTDKGGLLIFARGTQLPDNAAVPELWPQVALVKLADDPRRLSETDPRAPVDPQSLVVQGTLEETLVTGQRPGPLIVLQGITLLNDSIALTIVGPVPATPTTAALRDHFTALIRPAVLCFPPPTPSVDVGPSPLPRIDTGGILVTPHLTGQSADATETGDKPLFDAKGVASAPLVREVRRGCLPMGRYAISLVYPDGQAWTVPNESGGCAPAEGAILPGDRVGNCAVKHRTVLLSQGARAVVEIIGANDQSICDANPVPVECTAQP